MDIRIGNRYFDVTINKEYKLSEVANRDGAIDEYLHVVDINLLIKVMKLTLMSFTPGKRLSNISNYLRGTQAICKDTGRVTIVVIQEVVKWLYYSIAQDKIHDMDVPYMVASFIDTLGLNSFKATAIQDKIALDEQLNRFPAADIDKLADKYRYLEISDITNLRLTLD
jgi:hypothetical protein